MLKDSTYITISRNEDHTSFKNDYAYKLCIVNSKTDLVWRKQKHNVSWHNEVHIETQ